jgi:hypothetical protein
MLLNWKQQINSSLLKQYSAKNTGNAFDSTNNNGNSSINCNNNIKLSIGQTGDFIVLKMNSD